MTNLKMSLDVLKVLKQCSEETYCIVKLNNKFPEYTQGSDLDIFCLDLVKMSRIIVRALESYVKNGYTLSVTTVSPSQIHIDYLLPDGAIDFRFDLMASIPEYKKVSIKESLLQAILEGRQKKIFNGATVFVPSKIDDILIRYLEYLEYFEQRPDKIKHLDYVISEIEKDEDARQFLKRLHLYTKFKLLDVPEGSHFARAIVEDSQGVISAMQDELVNQDARIDKLNNMLEKLLNSQSDIDQRIKQDIRTEIDALGNVVRAEIASVRDSEVLKIGRILRHPLSIPGKTFRFIKRKVSRK